MSHVITLLQQDFLEPYMLVGQSWKWLLIQHFCILVKEPVPLATHCSILKLVMVVMWKKLASKEINRWIKMSIKTSESGKTRRQSCSCKEMSNS